MKRIAYLSSILIAATGISLAQTPPTGGWRRAGDPAPQAETAAPPVSEQDPSQPVARADEYGQAQAPQAPPAAQMPQAPPPPHRPAYGLPPQATIPAGTFITVRVNQVLSSDHNQQGDYFSATLAQPIVVDGIVVAQRGQNVNGVVTEAKKTRRGQGPSRLGLQVSGVTLADGTQAPIQSQLVTRNGRSSTGQDVATVASTTAVGAAIGAAADWGRGAAIGAGAGAFAGLVGVLLTPNQPTVVYPETALTFRLANPVTVNLSHAPQAFRYVGPYEYDQPVTTQMGRRPAPRPAPGPAPGYYGPYAYPPYGYPYYGYPYGYYPYYGGGFAVVVRGGHGRRW